MNKVWINHRFYDPESYGSGKLPLDSLPEFERKILSLIIDFRRGKEIFEFLTSGTTGKSKRIIIHRNDLITSARLTLQKLGIRENGNALLCLNPDYIAGTMMIIRSMTGNLHLFAIDPGSNPLSGVPDNRVFHLCAMVPMQLRESIDDPDTRRKIARIKILLVGGAPMDRTLINDCRGLQTGIFLTFGMTETVSHIALRKINGSSAQPYFEALPGIVFDTDKRGCLTIVGPVTGKSPVITNDIVKLLDNRRFMWKGRIDHVIISGGIKLIPEELEQEFSRLFLNNRLNVNFFLTGIKDRKLGNKLGIIIETGTGETEISVLKKILRESVDQYQVPREWRVIREFIRSDTRKINRTESLNASEMAD